MWQIALGLIQAGAGIYSGWKQKEAAYDNANIMRENADAQRNQAFDQATTMKTQANAATGGQVNAIASSGVKQAGSPLALLRQNEKNMNRDVGRTRIAGQLAKEAGYNQASSLEKQGDQAFTASLIGGATSFAGTLANNVNIPKSTQTPSLTGQQKTAINNSDINYADFGGQGNRSSLPPYTNNGFNGSILGPGMSNPSKITRGPLYSAKADSWQKKYGNVWE